MLITHYTLCRYYGSYRNTEHCSARNVACNILFSHSHCIDAAKEKDSLFENKVLQKIIDIVGGPDAFCSLPKLIWKVSFFDRFSSISTISTIFAKDLSDPVMVGVDSKKRPFISFNTTQNSNGAMPIVTTIFQASAQDANSLWLKGGGVFGPMNLVRVCGSEESTEDLCLDIFTTPYKKREVEAPFQVGLGLNMNEFKTSMRKYMFIEPKLTMGEL